MAATVTMSGPYNFELIHIIMHLVVEARQCDLLNVRKDLNPLALENTSSISQDTQIPSCVHHHLGS